MEVTKYLCEFFFTDFSNWLGLLILVAVIFYPKKVVIHYKENEDSHE